MSEYSKLKRACEEHNKIARNVTISNDKNRMKKYCEYWNAVKGDFMISGCGAYYRYEALVPAICMYEPFQNNTTIVFTNSSNLTTELVKCIKSSSLHRALIVFSQEHRNYHFFEGMNNASIAQCICDIASMNGYGNISELNNYATAFMKIVASKYSPSLASMVSLAQKNVKEITQIAQKNGVSANIITELNNNSASSNTFRNLLEGFYSEARNITNSKCATHATLTNYIRSEKYNNPIIVIELPVAFNYLDVYFEKELMSLKNYNLIIDSLSFKCVDSPFVKTLNTLIKSGQIPVGLCGEDVYEILGKERGIKNEIILQHSTPAMTEKYSSEFKTYERKEIEVTYVGIPAGTSLWDRLFNGDLGKNYKIAKIDTPRVKSDDLEEHHALLYGHIGSTIELIR